MARIAFEVVYAHKKWRGKSMLLFTHLGFEMQHACIHDG